MRPVRLVTIPSEDVTFRDDVHAMLASLPSDLEDAEVLARFEEALRVRYPGAVVRAVDPLAERDPDVADEWLVFRQQFRSRISTSVSVPLSVENAFALYTERVVQWQSAVQLTAIRRTRGLVGDEYDAAYTLLGRQFHGRFRIVSATPPIALAVEASGSGIHVWYVTRFSAEEQGTRVSVEGDYDLPEGILPRIADRLFIERTIEGDIESAHATFVALCERTALAGGPWPVRSPE